MNYRDAIKRAMGSLAEDKKRIFLGYNILYGSQAYGTLSEVPKEQRLETPVAENLMVGLAAGMSLEGYKPVVFFERHDFLLNALDAIVNHVDKIGKLSHGQFSMPVMIRAVVGSKKPLNPGLQHTQDFTETLEKLISFPVINLKNPAQIISEYGRFKESNSPVMFIERRDLYDSE